MNNEQRTISRKQKRGVTFLISIFSFIILMISCDDPITSISNLPAAPEGKGSFSINIDNEARTILPSTPNLNDFAVYTLSFTPISGGTAAQVDRTNVTLASPIFLDTGTYNLIVSAYKDNEKTQLMAQGTAENITIITGQNTSVSVTLKALLSGGTGIFRWNISMPFDVSSASMIITPTNGDGTPEQTVSLSQFNTAGNRTLNSGLYNIIIHLEKPDGKKIVWHKLLYIYQNLESIYNHEFTNAHFSESIYTVTINYNNGSIDGKESVLHGGTVKRPDDPIRDKYIFGGWFTDTAFTKPYDDFDKPVIESFTLYAKWVTIPVTGVQLNVNSLVLYTLDRETLTATVFPADATNKNITWSSDRPHTVSVDNEGRIAAHGFGTATITVTTEDGNWKASCNIIVHDPMGIPVERYKAVPNDDSGKIKYSFTYNEFDFYHIYLGRMENVPFFAPDVATISHNGGTRNFVYTEVNTEETIVKTAVITSIEETIGYVETNTTATNTGGKSSWKDYWEAGVSTEFKIKKIAEIKTSAKHSQTTSGEESWSEHTSKTTTDTFVQTRSRVDTLEEATRHARQISVSQNFTVSPTNKPGEYQLAMFAKTDVYLYVIKDTLTNELYYEFYEHVVFDDENRFQWIVEYAEPNQPFKRSDSGFNIDIPVLENLPKPDLVFCTPGLAFTLINNGTAYSVSRGNVTATTVIIPEVHEGLPVTAIANSGFSSYTNMSSIEIPNSVTSIGNSAFSGCTGLTNIEIPNSVTSIGASAFSGCTGLESITVGMNNPNYTSRDGILYNKTITQILAVPGGISGSFTTPNSVTSIGDGAFVGCTGLTSITIPNNVTSIGSYAFEGCTGLTSITIPNNVTSIGSYAFWGCIGLTLVRLQRWESHLSGISRITSAGTTPFGTNFNADLRIVVPGGSSSVYRAATNWSNSSIVNRIHAAGCTDASVTANCTQCN